MKDIKNPVNRKNVFFFNIFQKLINSVKTYVNDTEEDTFGKWFNTEYDQDANKLNIIPKINDDGALNINYNDGFISLMVNDKYINIPYDDSISIHGDYIHLSTSIDNDNLLFVIEPTDIKISFNDNTYTIQGSNINTLVNAAEYSYDEDNTTYILNLFPNANHDFADYHRCVNFSANHIIRLSDEGFGLHFENADILKNSWILTISDGSVSIAASDHDNTIQSNYIGSGYISITHKNDDNEQDSDKVLEFKDETNNLTVTFTVAELIAIKNSIINQ